MYCKLIGILTTLKLLIKGTNAIVSGHRYLQTYENDDLELLECQECGHVSVGWLKEV